MSYSMTESNSTVWVETVSGPNNQQSLRVNGAPADSMLLICRRPAPVDVTTPSRQQTLVATYAVEQQGPVTITDLFLFWRTLTNWIKEQKATTKKEAFVISFVTYVSKALQTLETQD